MIDELRAAAAASRRSAADGGADEAEMLEADAIMFETAATRIAALEAALRDVVASYEDTRDRIRAGTANKPSVSGQTFINRARELLACTRE